MKKLLLIFLFLLSLVNINQVSASHMLGGDLTWKCVGNDSFLIKLVVYSDCNGSVVSGSNLISFECQATGVIIKYLSFSTGTPVDITPVCYSSCTRCSSTSCSFPYGIKKYTMQGIINLSSAGSCCNIRMYWSESVRTASITTIPNPQYNDFYVEAYLNRCLNPCDNSPSFTNPPFAILCVSQNASFNFGVQDIDVKSTGGLLDSITYEWANPLGALQTIISYKSPFTYDKPITFLGFPLSTSTLPNGFHLDPINGDIKFRPTKSEVTIMVVKVNEFRNGVKIGEVRRDMTIFVIPCLANKSPIITTPNNITSKSVCSGDTALFNFSTNDSNTNDTLTISWNNSLPGAVWTHTNGLSKRPTATLKWVPTTAKEGTLPYIFTVTVKDNACPLNSQFTQAYQIYVNPVPKAKISISDSGCGKFYFKVLPISGYYPTYKWSSGVFTFSPNTGPLVNHDFLSGQYPFKLEMITPGCSRSFYDTAKVNSFMSVSLPADTAVCINSTITVKANIQNALIPYKIQWGSGKVSFYGDTTLTKQITITKDTSIWIKATHGSYKCPYDEIKIKVHPKYTISLPNDTNFCNINYVLLPKLTPKISAFRSFKWYKKASSLVVDTDAYLNVHDTGKFKCVVIDTFSCSTSDSVSIHINPKIVASANGKVICYGEEAQLIADSTGGIATRYYWYDGTKLIGNTRKLKVKPTGSTGYNLIERETTGGVTCSDSVIVWVTVNPLPFIMINLIDNVCCNGPSFNLNKFVKIDGKFRAGGSWRSKSPGMINDSIFNPVLAGSIINYPGLKVNFDFTDPVTGCFNKDSTYFLIYDIPTTYAGDDDSICTGNFKSLFGEPELPIGTWRGTGVEGSYPNWKFNPDKSGIVNGGKYPAIYHYQDYNQCENEDTMMITVFSMPNVEAGNNMNFCYNANPISLIGTPSGGLWSGKGTTANKFDPTTANIGNNILKYSFTNVICTATDTANYVVFGKPQTPNISLSAIDTFLECNLMNGNYEWFYKQDSSSAPTAINSNKRRVNPHLYCKGCYFSVVYTDANGCVSDTSTLFHYAVNSINFGKPVTQFVIYPNPAHSLLFIENPYFENANLILSDIFGKNLNQQKILHGKNSLNISALKPGIYIIRLNDSYLYRLVVE